MTYAEAKALLAPKVNRREEHRKYKEEVLKDVLEEGEKPKHRKYRKYGSKQNF
jgi:hypothetical protein